MQKTTLTQSVQHLLLAVAFVICLLASHQSRTHAASFDLSVSPLIFQVELTPPAVADVKEQIVLENTSDTAMDLEIVFLPFKPKGENGEVAYLESGDVGGADPLIFQRISILQNGKRVETIHIPPQTKRTFDFVVSIPKDEPPSDYYFTILFVSQLDEESQTQSTQSLSSGGVGINVLLSVGPKGKTKGEIEEFSTDLFQTEGPVAFDVKIRNTSPHFIYPKANILIKNMFGQTIGKVDLLPVNILSDSTRSLPSKEQFVLAAQESERKDTDEKLPKAIEDLLANPNQPVAIWPERFLLGPYQAVLTVALSDEGPVYTRSITFIGFPLHILTGTLVALLIILFIRSRLKKQGALRK